MNETIDTDLRDVVQFHGHLCPGLALGYRVAKAALRELGADRPHDEELVAVVENDACGVDAVQFVTGCTFGKGNLIYRDYGKHVYSFWNRRSGKGVRVSVEFPGGESEKVATQLRERQQKGDDVSREMRELKMKRSNEILSADEKDFLSVSPATEPQPAEAKIRSSVRCSFCNEKFMESRGRVREGKVCCIPCAEQDAR